MRRSGRLLALLSLVAAGCAAAGVPLVVSDDLARARRQYPDATLAELERGRALYVGRCTSCHRAVAPGALSPDVWRLQLERMSERAGLQEGEGAVIERYLVATGSRSAAPRKNSP